MPKLNMERVRRIHLALDHHGERLRTRWKDGEEMLPDDEQTQLDQEITAAWIASIEAGFIAKSAAVARIMVGADEGDKAVLALAFTVGVHVGAELKED